MQVSVVSQSASKDNDVPCWLTDDATDALFQRDIHGKLTPNPKTVRYSQMIDADAYVKNLRFGEDTYCGQIFQDFETIVTSPELLIVHPTTSIERFVSGMKAKTCGGIGETAKYNYIGKALIPHQLLRMPEVWVNLKRSAYTTRH